MPKKKLTCPQINYYLKDERKAAKAYGKLGLTSLAKDERRHARFFERKKRRCK